MANIKSQKKRVKTNEKARQRNKAIKSELRTHVRNFRAAVAEGDKAKAVEQWKQARAAGKKSKTLERKIAEEAYLEGPEDESGDD